MSEATCNCAQHVKWLTQQISVMRKEINNLRQRMESAVRAHRKQVASLQSLLMDGPSEEKQRRVKMMIRPSSPTAAGSEISLERGRVLTQPIGFITSCFAQKNGTPRQPSVCSSSRASLRIQTSVFNNPEHALSGLQLFSHIWLIFVFHKNGHMSCKAKVKPPRLDGQKVGVYSTRSPHRPNAMGLTLVKLEQVAGPVLHLSGVDLISGTPVLDIKPYIPEYDSPLAPCTLRQVGSDPPPCPPQEQPQGITEVPEDLPETGVSGVLAPLCEDLQQGALCTREEEESSIAGWIRKPPVGTLSVRFTPTAERELARFTSPHNSDSGGMKFRFLKDPEEAAAAIRSVLAADPRSVYRRTRCDDRLFFFSLDTAHVTCWFGDGFAEVLRVRAARSDGAEAAPGRDAS